MADSQGIGRKVEVFPTPYTEPVRARFIASSPSQYITSNSFGRASFPLKLMCSFTLISITDLSRFHCLNLVGLVIVLSDLELVCLATSPVSRSVLLLADTSALGCFFDLPLDMLADAFDCSLSLV
jgi:hypothetical protein